MHKHLTTIKSYTLTTACLELTKTKITCQTKDFFQLAFCLFEWTQYWTLGDTASDFYLAGSVYQKDSPPEWMALPPLTLSTPPFMFTTLTSPLVTAPSGLDVWCSLHVQCEVGCQNSPLDHLQSGFVLVQGEPAQDLVSLFGEHSKCVLLNDLV